MFSGKHRLGAQSNNQVAKMPLTVDADSLSFAEVWEDTRFHWKVPLHNPTDREVVVDDVFTSCTCSVVEGKKFAVAPGETHDVELVIDLTRQSGATETNGIRDFGVKLAPTVRGEDGTPIKAAWLVQGRVRTAFRLTPRLVDFGTQSVEGQPLMPQRLEIKGHFVLDELTVATSNKDLKVEIRRLSETDSHFELIVTPMKPMPVGKIEAEVRLHPRSPQYPTIPVQFIAVAGQIVEDVQAIPASVSFGSRTVGEVAEEVITLESLTKSGFTVESWRVRGEGLTVERERETGAFKVRQVAKAAGEHATGIEFEVRTAAGRQFLLAVAVSYYGIAAENSEKR